MAVVAVATAGGAANVRKIVEMRFENRLFDFSTRKRGEFRGEMRKSANGAILSSIGAVIFEIFAKRSKFSTQFSKPSIFI